MVSEISAVVAAIMSCISAWFAMYAATTDMRHWRHIKRKNHDLIFVISPSYETWNFTKIQADMQGVLPDEKGQVFPISPDINKLLKAVTFSMEIVDNQVVLFGDVSNDINIVYVRKYFMLSKWFSAVEYTRRGKKRLK